MKTYKHNEKNEITIKDFGFIVIWWILLLFGIMMLPGLL